MPIYLDYQATTPLDPRVLEAMLPYMTGPVGNPHSTSHLHGIEAGSAVERARGQVAAAIGAEADEIVFTSGATEANNMLLSGVAADARARGRSVVVTCVTEHKAVLDVARGLAPEGSSVRIVPVDGSGFVDLAALDRALDEEVAVVSVMAANNEVGVLQPLAEISAMARAVGAMTHSDAAQAVGKVAFAVAEAGVDMASVSAHKLYGPMGIGAAYVARPLRRRLRPLLHGGGQEGGLRSGTLPVALCVGFGEACKVAAREMSEESSRLLAYRRTFLHALVAAGTTFQVNGDLERRLPGNLNLHFPGVDAEALLMSVRGSLSISSGSACTAASIEPSHVVEAIGGAERAEESVRIGFGRQTTEAEVVAAARILSDAVAGLDRVRYRRVVEA